MVSESWQTSPVVINEACLTGQSQSHVCACWCDVMVHRDVLKPLQTLRDEAEREGFDLAIASGFRSFERQLAIWEGKLSGVRPLLSSSGELMNVSDMSEAEKLSALLRWSAVPGTSRHHWGTDLDVYDATSLSEGYQLQLVPEEYQSGGPFAEFYLWLVDYLSSSCSPDFFFPYNKDYGAVAPEPWHISFRPVADQYQQSYSPDVWRRLLSDKRLPLKQELLACSDRIYSRYIQLDNVSL